MRIVKQPCCSETPILAYGDYDKPFHLQMDASKKRLGVVLYQIQNYGTTRVIAYASRTLSKSDKNYDAHKLEFLAFKWAITNRCYEYLYGGNFEVFTDNNPLTYFLTTAKLEDTSQRWVASHTNYNFKLHYKSGKLNVKADALSRIPWEWEEALHTLDTCSQGNNLEEGTMDIVPFLRYLQVQFQWLLKVLWLTVPHSSPSKIEKWSNKQIQT